MSSQDRKDERRQEFKLSKYPSRSEAVFDDENDHNPLILKDCLRCSGTGKVDIHQRQANVETWSLEVCPVCSGTGTTGEITPYFENNSPALDVKANADGWLKCPCCGWKFAVKDQNVWTGRRHKRCGQKLNIV